ncbi:TPA: hypothetical protein L8Q80_003995 [Klebsiella pneumoniae]|uniref:hypothetical protein n=1 Tax=Serratia ureilytica TaxID=300181 RepID=UPI0018693938|nr:hypothetical protein [Serratia ureilytica]MDN2473349.1 hypothetical protein [Serratia ureilytica]HBQ7493257.1 hypothetical protein [Klebsiella pneumoniae]
MSNNVVCPARFDEWLKGLCDPSPFSVTGNPDSDQQRIAQNVIQVYFFCDHYPGIKRYNTVSDILDCNNARGLYNMVKDAADWLTQTSRYQRKLVRPSPVKALLNTRVLSGETHLKVGFVISGVW